MTFQEMCNQALKEAREAYEAEHAEEIRKLKDWEDFLRYMGWKEEQLEG